MAAVARQQLANTSDELRLAFSGLQAVDVQVASLTACANGHPLPEAAAQVRQAAKMAKTRAARVLQAAEAAETAASKAVAIVDAAQVAKATASEAAARAEKAAAQAAQTARVAAEAAAEEEAAAAALEAAMAPSVPVRSMRHSRKGKKISQDEGTISAARMAAAHDGVEVAVKTGESDVSEDDEEDEVPPSSCAGGVEAGDTDFERKGDHEAIESDVDRNDAENQEQSSSCVAVAEVGNADLESQAGHKAEHCMGAEEVGEDEPGEQQENRENFQAKLGKRKLESTRQASRRSSRVADFPQPSYAER